eukprot:m.248089 g.248089  ORF g.248089 m.248089 type:complete len:119 (-) comp16131_c0_seq27:977-1333(-)
MLKAVAVSIDKNLDDDLGFCPWQREPGRVNKAKGYQGLRTIWLTQLQLFHGVSLAKAEAICKHYPSPKALIEAFLLSGEAAIANVPVKGPGKTARIGPKISSIMHKYFTATSGDVLIS